MSRPIDSQPIEVQTAGEPVPSVERAVFRAFVIALITLVVFWPVVTFDFVAYDDNLYVTENRYVQREITGDSIAWAFTHPMCDNYHPITILSHMIDFHFYRLTPAGHHASSLIVHVLNAILLFCVLLRIIGNVWPITVATLLFALHPLRVESVAWIAERKDVLSLFFALLTFWFYSSYVEQTKENVNQRRRRVSYALAVVSLALGLMSKPMVVTIPFMLLLLDIWPLRRIELSTCANALRQLRDLVQEKLWFFALIIPSVLVTLFAQSRAIKTTEQVPLALRLQNAPIAIVDYLQKTFWPTKMAVLYPFPAAFAWWKVAVSILIIATITIAVVRFIRRAPELAVGWFWFLGGLVPVLGFVQAGEQRMADRYTYLPAIGLFAAIVWFLNSKLPKRFFSALSIAAVVACILVTRHQLQFWQNTFTLFERAVAVTQGNFVAEYNLANMLLASGQTDSALEHYRASIAAAPKRPEPRNNYAKALAQTGRLDESIAEFNGAILANSNYAKAYCNLGAVLATQGRLDEAAQNLQRAVELDPSDADAELNLGNVCYRQQKTNEAVQHYNFAIQLNPTEPSAHYWMAKLLVPTDPLAAVKHFSEAIRLRPDWVPALNEAAWLFATHRHPDVRNGGYAAKFARIACELTQYRDPKSLAALDVALAEVGNYTDAIRVAEQELQMFKAAGQDAKTGFIQERITLYRSGKPYHQP